MKVGRRLARCVFAVCVIAAGTLPFPVAAAETTQTWLEVKSPHFTVITNGPAEKARGAAFQFEQERAILQMLFPQAQVDPGVPVCIVALTDEISLSELLPGFWEKKGQAHPAGIFF